MTRKETGGSAFPLALGWIETDTNNGNQKSVDVREVSHGMSLRDYFAAKCNVEVYVPVDVFYRTYGRNPDASELAKLIAEIRYIEADAMLAARGEP